MMTVNHVCSPACPAAGHPHTTRTITLPVQPHYAGLHFHVASGLTGYGPDAADGNIGTADTAESFADLIRTELDTWADYESDGARSYAESGDYKAAWEMREHSDAIDNLRANLDNTRATAPLYAGDPTAWHATILRTVDEHFPYPVNENRSRVYAWPCYMTRTECTIDPADESE